MRCCLAVIMKKKVWVIVKRERSVASKIALFSKKMHHTRGLSSHAHPEFGVFVMFSLLLDQNCSLLFPIKQYELDAMF